MVRARTATGAVLIRMAAAIAGGYVFTVVASVALAYALPMPRAEAVLIGTLVSFFVYAATVVWVFAARPLSRMLCGLLGGIVALSTLVFLLRPEQAPW